MSDRIPLPQPFAIRKTLNRALIHSPSRQSIYTFRRYTTPEIPSHPSLPEPDRRSSAPPQITHAHQLAAETLLTMAPGGTPTSPDKKTDTPSTTASVPAPTGGRITPQIDDPRGLKRKNEEDEAAARPRPGSVLGLSTADKEKPKEQAFSRSPLTTHDKPAVPPALPGRTQPTATSSILGSAPAGPPRYSIYGPTARDSIASSPWAALSQRYNSLGLRRDLSPSVPTTAPKPNPASALSPPRRASPDPHGRFHPTAVPAPGASAASYSQYAMGRRELQEHREQLREGKRWLEGMLIKTDKMIHMVENKMALAPNDAAIRSPALATSQAHASSISTNPAPKHSEDWEFEERERHRQKEIERLEAERERDRLEREKRERERADRERSERDRAERERGDRERMQERIASSDREHGLGGVGGFFGGRDTRGIATLGRERDRNEAERNRDLLLSSRRVTAVSPNGRERSTPGAAPGSSGSTAHAHGPGHSNGSTPSTVGSASGAPGAAASGNGERKVGGWDGEPVMGGVALPRRDQGMRLGRGLWSFDVRG
jgi:GATA-binding protein